MTYDIFLSYASADTGLASELRDAFQIRGVNCFMAKKDIQAAEDWENSIRQAMLEAYTVIVLLTPRSIKSDWVLMETGAAWALDKRRMAALVQVDAIEMNAPLSRKQAMKIETSEEKSRFIDAVAAFERAPTTPQIDFEFRRVTGGEWEVVLLPKNSIPFEYVVTLSDEEGKTVSNKFQAGYHRFFPENGEELRHPITYKMNSPHLRGRETFMVVVKVAYRQLDGPFSDTLTKRYKMRVNP